VPPNRNYVRFYQEVLSIHLITSVIFAEDGHGSIPVWDIIRCILTQNGFLMLQKWQFVTECLSGDKRQTSDLKFRIFLAVGSITSVLFFFGGKKVDNHITKEALDGLGDFKVGGQIIQTVKY